jgi:hypothetical protein
MQGVEGLSVATTFRLFAHMQLLNIHHRIFNISCLRLCENTAGKAASCHCGADPAWAVHMQGTVSIC